MDLRKVGTAADEENEVEEAITGLKYKIQKAISEMQEKCLRNVWILCVERVTGFQGLKLENWNCWRFLETELFETRNRRLAELLRIVADL